MNFLAHYYSLPQKDNPYLILGGLLPDIIPKFSRIYNKSLKINLNGGDDVMRSISNGIELHMKGDFIFHNHPLFEKGCLSAKKIIKEKFSDKIQRDFAIAHVMVELHLDRFVAQENQRLGEEFYRQLAQVDMREITRYLQSKELAEHNTTFISNFKGFLDGNYLQYSLYDKGTIFALKNILGARIAENTFQNIEKWEQVSKLVYLEVEKIAADLLQDVLINLEKKLIDEDKE